MSLIASVWILLACAHLLGWLAQSLKQPALLGQMLAGILVGPTLLGWVKADAGLGALVDFSVLFVVLTAGLEMRLRHLTDTLRGKGAFALLLGFLVPAASAAAFAWALGMDFIPGAVTVLCISVTALPVALRILSAFGLLHTRVARVAIASSLLADLIVLLVLGTLMAVVSHEDGVGSLWQIGGMACLKLLLLLGLVGACRYCCAWLSKRRIASTNSPISPALDQTLVLTVIFVAGLGVTSEWLGFHYVTGVFFASLLVNAELVGETRFRSMTQTFELMTSAVFAPLFLAYQGIQFEVGALQDVGLVAGLLCIAIVSKLLGGYAAARWNGLSKYEACGVGIVTNARGVMGMVVATIAFRAGLVGQDLFSTLLIIGIATTLITPSMLKQWLKDDAKVKTMLGTGEGAG
jgi:Kef-type K+ transport system membrane component KefB